MAEIKTTLEMVLARADAMCVNAPDLPDDTQLHAGMKFAASFMKSSGVDISEKLSALAPGELPLYVQGMLKTFSRFIALPRDDSQPWQGALHGINDMAVVSMPTFPPDLANILSEIGSLLGRYRDHRGQIKSRLEESFAAHTAQLAQSMAQQTGQAMDISPDQHPKFNEEWVKAVGQLNDQYTNALDQYKAALEQIFNLSG